MKIFIWLFLFSFMAFAAFDGSEQQIIDLKIELRATVTKVRLLKRKITTLENKKIEIPLTQEEIDTAVTTQTKDLDDLIKDLKLTTGQ